MHARRRCILLLSIKNIHLKICKYKNNLYLCSVLIG